ncbi:hypothetical protein EES39_20360 [Streptomyces sp. ADI92-24]|uniref:hypothetical protein n=1 Tax=Streptomyces TaxID=1883 RepID=UPI000F553911|nr:MULTISPECIES: hypothetical protein [Streptomyces]MBO0914722.1 hypothetical protein [Streptomyces laculatispora]MCX4769588.1 hypothetical protein [Streptomyces sp. NBC_01285]ROQ83047.1 hypothetical protein EDD95_2690 [Streptomyces sp. CEV 2-1]RPK42701.1 hypothetical protein EES39_20360 [Streptomyces sp. ADI92-24]
MRSNQAPASAHHIQTWGSQARPNWFFPLVRSWAVGLVALTLMSVLVNYAVQGVFDSRLYSFGWRVALIYVPNVLTMIACVLAAARVHRAPHRDSPPRHLTAALAVPVFTLAVSLVHGWGGLDAEAGSMMFAAVLLGSTAALALDRVLESRR